MNTIAYDPTLFATWHIIVRNDTDGTSEPQECSCATKTRNDWMGDIVEEYSATCYDLYGPIPLLIGPGVPSTTAPGVY